MTDTNYETVDFLTPKTELSQTDNFKNLSGKGYYLQEQIGQGGFGVVYRAYQPVVDRDVAVKIIRNEHANQASFVRRFEIEAHIIARLEHIHIVPLYDYWREPDSTCLVMRYLRGGSLRGAIRGGSLPVQYIGHVMDQIGSALLTAHRKKIVHQDLKPDNVLFDTEGNAYLVDFGIARDLVGYRDVKISAGSPAYISPEQIKGGHITPRTDIYSLGIILFEMITGTIPFLGATEKQLMEYHVQRDIPALQEVNKELPYIWNTVIQKATARDSDLRYENIQRFLADVHRVILENEPDEEMILPVMAMPAPTDEVSDATVEFDSIFKVENPYKGLRPFEEADAQDFFGRENFVEKLIEQIASDEQYSRFLAVVGPGGSGKSSAVKAGLLPLLRQGALAGADKWFISVITPGVDLMRSIARALLSVASSDIELEWLEQKLAQHQEGLTAAIQKVLPENDEDSQVLLVIDQFEEVFTLNQDEEKRQAILKSLYHGVTASESRLRVIITLRADFYDRPLLYEGFSDLMQARTEVILPLSPVQIERVIRGPAEQVGIEVETALVDYIQRDVSGRPAVLPLLQYVLTELFEQRKGNTLTAEVYQEIGRVPGALARRADEIYQVLDDDQKEATRQLFLRLINTSEESLNTRRRVRRDVLWSLNESRREEMEMVLNLYGQYRLLTFDHEPVTRAPVIEIAHESLIKHWDQLQKWLEDSRNDLVLQRNLATMVEAWEKSGRDSSFLATGNRLVRFEPLLETNNIALSQAEIAYLDASTELRKRRTRLAQILSAVLVALTIVALISGGLALFARQQAVDAEATAVAERDLASNRAEIARSRELAIIALTNLESVDLAALLSIEAVQTASTYEAQNSLLTILQSQPYLQTFLRVESVNPVRRVDMSPDGEWAAAGRLDGQVALWDAELPRREGEVRSIHSERVNALEFSPDSRLLATGSADDMVVIQSVASGEVVHRLEGHADDIWALAFNPAGTQLASGSADGTIRLWDTETGEQIGDPLEGHEDIVFALAFRPNSTEMASAGADGTIQLWDTETGEPTGDPLEGHDNWVLSLAYSPDGGLIISGGDDNTVLMWDMLMPQQPVDSFEVESGAWIRDVTFSPDGREFAVATTRNLIHIWDTAPGAGDAQILTAHLAPVWGIDYAPDGYHMVSGDASGTVIYWDRRLPRPAVPRLSYQETAEVWKAVVSPDGAWLATLNDNPDGGTQLIVRDAGTFEVQSIYTDSRILTDLIFSPESDKLAISTLDSTVLIYDVEATAILHELDEPFASSMLSVVFDAAGERLLAGNEDGNIYVWDAQSGEPLNLPSIEHEQGIADLALSPNGRHMVTADKGGRVVVWDAQSLEPLETLDGLHEDSIAALAFSPDGRWLATGGHDTTIILVNTTTWTPAGVSLTGHEDWVTGLVFSPDSNWLVSSSHDNTLRLWNVNTRQPAGRPFNGHQDWVMDVGIMPDGNHVISVGMDGQVIVWNIQLTYWQSEACVLANRNLTQVEIARYFAGYGYQPTCQ